jgi:fumarate reductase flavoprotein subunit
MFFEAGVRMNRRALLTACAVMSSAFLATSAGWSAAVAKTITHEVDVVVVGSGAAGLSAAVEAQESGLKTILLEKRPTLGGSSLYIEGTFAVESQFQKGMYVGMSKDDAFKIAMEFNHGRINGPLVRRWINNSGATIDWIVAHGVTIHDVRTLFVDGNRTWHIFKDGQGIEFVEKMTQAFKKAGGVVMTETPAKELIMDGNRVAGVVASNADGDSVEIKASGGVVLAAGGFINNKDMLKKYGIDPTYLIIGPPNGHEGDATKMYEKIGAKLEGMSTHLAIGAWLPGKDPNTQLYGMGIYPQLTAVLRQPWMWVSKQGTRFMDEAYAPQWMVTDHAVARVGGYYFSVFDDESREYMIKTGVDISHSDWVRVGAKLDKLDEGLTVGQKEGYVFKGSTIEELAGKMGVDPAALRKTVEDNNRYAVQGYDEEFPKPRKFIRPVKKGPFWAVRGQQGTLITLGGPTTTTDMQVLKQDGTPIPGLYAAGVETGGIFGDSYSLLLEGAASSMAMNTGRFAAQAIRATRKK